MPFEAVVFSSLSGVNPGVELMRLTQAVTGGTLSTALPGGFSQASLTLAPGWRQPFPRSAHLEIYGPGHAGRASVVWEGRIVRVTRTGRDVTTLEASGYGLLATEDDILEATATTDEPQLDASICLERALAASCPLIGIGAEWQASGVQHALSLFNERTALQVAQQVTQEANYDFAVWDMRLATFQARTAPATPRYLLPAEWVPNWQEDEAALWTAVRVKYTDHGTNAAAVYDYSDPEAAVAAGVTRHTVQSIGTTDAAGAAAYAASFIDKSKLPVVRATLGPVTSLRTPYGSHVAAHDVRAGQWAQVQDRTPQIIVNTSLDWNTGAVTAQLGQPVLNQAGVITEVVRVVRAIKAGSNPLTGAVA